MHSLRFEPESPRWHVRILPVRPTTTGTTRLTNTSTASMTQLLFLFGELKPEHSSNNKLLVTDLYRLAILMKEEIDLKNLQMAIGFQVVGSSVKLYGIELSLCGIYKFAELFPNYAFAARPCWSSLAKFTVTNVLSQT
ncbi:hypothetical protein G6F42_008622 [Rhizopus arrhizus]|nr:hypothetical protein G6F42_008622 [Rhizopus arrhizus]